MIESLEADLQDSQNQCSIAERRCQSLIQDLKVKSDQMEEELRQGMERDIKI